MREILFRGMNDSGVWFYGAYRPVYNMGVLVASIEYQLPIGVLQDEYVKEETIGQYTGLKDKNGKKIFEGDIVLFDDHIRTEFEVVFVNGSFGTRENKENFFSFNIRYINEYEIIGNIHETK